MKIDTMSQLVNGKVVSNGDHKVIIGETDVIAFTDSFGEWQYAENVHWQEGPSDLDHLLRRKKLNDIISREWPDGTLDEFYSESSDHAMVIDNHGIVWQIWPDGGIKSYR